MASLSMPQVAALLVGLSVQASAPQASAAPFQAWHTPTNAHAVALPAASSLHLLTAGMYRLQAAPSQAWQIFKCHMILPSHGLQQYLLHLTPCRRPQALRCNPVGQHPVRTTACCPAACLIRPRREQLRRQQLQHVTLPGMAQSNMPAAALPAGVPLHLLPAGTCRLCAAIQRGATLYEAPPAAPPHA